MSSQADLLVSLRTQVAALGFSVRGTPGQGLTGEVEAIRTKWWIGGRKVTHRMSCRLTESDHTVHFREAIIERSWGIPPPTFTVEKATVHGWHLSGQRTDASFGLGGGSLDYARARETVEQTTAAAGWKFHLEGGRMP